ncbi:glycoside hydrolase family 64 protein [Streptomyces vinaceus]|uniref:glycoside hydrolase family 64 protein n=1 Tax=Streptomyces vinaceus TaxID=1960 RepID=UPI0037FD5AC5
MKNYASQASARRRRLAGTAALAAALVTAPLVMTVAHAETAPAASLAGEDSAPFTQRVETDPATGGTRFVFTPAAGAAVDAVDVHYTVPGASRQSLRMQREGGDWVLAGPSTAEKFTYFFTYGRLNVSMVDTPTFSNGGGGNPTPTPPSQGGTFPLTINNNTGLPNDQVYVAIVGQASPGHYSYLTPDGRLLKVNEGANAPGAPNPTMSFKLSDIKGSLTLPAHLEGARIYVSEKKPLVMPAADGDRGYGQPDLNNPADPNRTTKFDFYEFTYQHGKIAFGSNTTQVDGFAIPMTADLTQKESDYDQKSGIDPKKAARLKDFSDYKSHVDDAFKKLVTADGHRIIAPRSSKDFKAGGPAAHYFDKAVNEAWTKWEKGFDISSDGVRFKGKAENGLLRFTKTQDGVTSPEGTVSKPSTSDIMGCEGTLAQGSDLEKQFEANICAAFNRGVALNSKDGGKTYDWADASKYYGAGATYNQYAKYFHDVGVGGRAYAFAYDDVNQQSSVTVLPNAEAPTSLTLTLGG